MAQRGTKGSTVDLKVPDRLYEGYVFDLDGTIYLGDHLLPGSKRLVGKLRELGNKVVFLSNNPTKSPEMYAAGETYVFPPAPRACTPSATTSSHRAWRLGSWGGLVRKKWR